VLDIRKAETPVDVLLAAAVISTLNFAFEISIDGVPRAATVPQQTRELRTVWEPPRRLEHIQQRSSHRSRDSGRGTVSSIRYSLFRYDT